MAVSILLAGHSSSTTTSDSLFGKYCRESRSRHRRARRRTRPTPLLPELDQKCEPPPRQSRPRSSCSAPEAAFSADFV